MARTTTTTRHDEGPDDETSHASKVWDAATGDDDDG